MVFVDIFRSHDLSGWAKALWVIFVIILPFLGVFVYLIARGSKMHERAAQQAAQQQQAFDQYVSQTAGTGTTRPTSCPSWRTSRRRASSATPSSRRRRPRSCPDAAARHSAPDQTPTCGVLVRGLKTRCPRRHRPCTVTVSPAVFLAATPGSASTGRWRDAHRSAGDHAVGEPAGAAGEEDLGKNRRLSVWILYTVCTCSTHL